MNASRASIVVLVALWVLAVVGAVGRFFIAWQWWDLVLALSGLAFSVGLILTLVKAGPDPAGLPLRAVLGEPDFWGRAVVILKHSIIGAALAVPISLFRALVLRLGQAGIAGSGLFVTGVLVSVLAMALLIVKRRAAQAAGYLFIVVLVPWMAAYLV